MPPAAAMAIGGLGSLAGGIIGSNAAGDAADKQAAAANNASNLQYQMFQQQMAAQNPFRQAGVSALYGPGGMFTRTDGGSGIATDPGAHDKFIQDQLDQAHQKLSGLSEYQRNAMGSSLPNDDAIRAAAEKQWGQSGQAGQPDTSKYQLDPSLTKSFSMADFQADPGYAFRMQQGQNALERSAAARGGLSSGGTIRGLTDYAQGAASQEYQNAYNRFTGDQTNRFNRLSAIAGMGQTANAAAGAAAQNYGDNMGSIGMANAKAQGAAGIAQGNAWSGALSGLGKTGMDYAAMNNNNNWLNKLGGSDFNVPQMGGASAPQAGPTLGMDYSFA